MTSKKEIRPIIPQAGINESTRREEIFQNVVLRPILKMQHDLLIAVVDSFLIKKKLKINEMTDLKKEQVLRNMLSSDMLLKSELRGMIIGQMELDEFNEYLVIQAEAKKRIATMLEERIVDAMILNKEE